MSRLDSSTFVAVVNRALGNSPVPPFQVELPDGSRHRFGGTPRAAGGDVDPDLSFVVRLKNETALAAARSLDELAIADGYLNGDIDIEGDFIELMRLRDHLTDKHFLLRVWRHLWPRVFGQVKTDNSVVPRHYDHGNEFYLTFLDQQHRLYSQALFRSENETLEQASGNKLRHIWDVCRLRPGCRVLDVGGGWGSFVGFAAGRGAKVTALTLSSEQYGYLSDMARQPEFEGNIEVVKQNILEYAPREKFDAVVILGVMEHLPDYERLLAHLSGLMGNTARVYMDFAAGRKKFELPTFAFRYTFEGNHTPVHMPGLMQAVNESPYELVLVQNDRLSYFLTVRAWARRLEDAREQLVRQVGLKVYRIFQLYLWSTAAGLFRGRLESYRVVLQKSRGRDAAEVGFAALPSFGE